MANYMAGNLPTHDKILTTGIGARDLSAAVSGQLSGAINAPLQPPQINEARMSTIQKIVYKLYILSSYYGIIVYYNVMSLKEKYRNFLEFFWTHKY